MVNVEKTNQSYSSYREKMDTTIEKIGCQIDSEEDNNDIEKLLELSKLCQSKLDTANEDDRVILKFYEANCFSAMAKTKSSDADYLWGWC